MKLPFFSKPAEVKDSPTGYAVYMQTKGRVKERNLKQYFDEGYKRNPIIYRCIREITTALGSVELEVHSGNKVLEGHQALDLLKKPNPTEGYAQFIRHAFTDYLISGNMFITADTDKAAPNELWVQSPMNMETVGGSKGLPLEYVFNGGSNKVKFPVSQIDGKSQCFHFKTYNPENPFVGLSPVSHVAQAADTHNNGIAWNSALLENGARPSGAFKFPDGVVLSQEEKGKFKEMMRARIQGSDNAGSTLLLDNGGEWQEIGQSAKDMDFLNTMNTMAKYIASAYGVPLPLVDNDAASYNNIEQAKERLWTDTVLPLLNEFLELFGNWLLPRYGKADLKFAYNLDSIPALEGLRARRFDRMSKLVAGGILTINEAREAIAYSPNTNPLSDVLMVPSSLMPLDAQVTDDTAKAMKLLGYSEAEMKQLIMDVYGK